MTSGNITTVHTSGRKNPNAPPSIRYLFRPSHTTLRWLSYRDMLTARIDIRSQSHITGVEPPHQSVRLQAWVSQLS
jgi:hypothetical protein